MIYIATSNYAIQGQRRTFSESETDKLIKLFETVKLRAHDNDDNHLDKEGSVLSLLISTTCQQLIMVLGVRMCLTTPSDVSLSSDESEPTKTSEKRRCHESKPITYIWSDSDDEPVKDVGDALRTSFDDLEYKKPETINAGAEDNDEEERIDDRMVEGPNGELPSAWGTGILNL